MGEIPVWIDAMMKRPQLRNNFFEMCDVRRHKHYDESRGFLLQSKFNESHIALAKAMVYEDLKRRIERNIEEAQRNEIALGKKGD